MTDESCLNQLVCTVPIESIYMLAEHIVQDDADSFLSGNILCAQLPQSFARLFF